MMFQINHYPLAQTVWHLPFDLTRNIWFACFAFKVDRGCCFSMNLESGQLEMILTHCGKLWTLAGLEEEKQCQ